MWISLNELNEVLEKLEDTKIMAIAWMNITTSGISILLEDYLGNEETTTHKFELSENVAAVPAINVKIIQEVLIDKMEFRYFNDGSWYIFNSSKEEYDFEIQDLVESLASFDEIKERVADVHPEDLIQF